MHGRVEKFILNFSRKTWRKETIGRPRLRWEDAIKTDLKETKCEAVKWVHLAQDREQ
jgi:hypothetical protein